MSWFVMFVTFLILYISVETGNNNKSNDIQKYPRTEVNFKDLDISTQVILINLFKGNCDSTLHKDVEVKGDLTQADVPGSYQISLLGSGRNMLVRFDTSITRDIHILVGRTVRVYGVLLSDYMIVTAIEVRDIEMDTFYFSGITPQAVFTYLGETD